MLLFCSSFWFWMTAFCLLVNGAAQAPIWPALTKVLSSWFPESKRSSAFGIISTAPYVGALAGTGIAIYIQDIYMYWRLVFVPFGILGAIVALVIQIGLKTPQEMNIEILEENKETVDKSKVEENKSFQEYFRIPGVSELSVAVFCLKFVRYAMFMWLPMYLIDHLGYSKVQGGVFSTMFDIGGILGGPCLGIFVDKLYPKRNVFGIYQVK